MNIYNFYKKENRIRFFSTIHYSLITVFIILITNHYSLFTSEAQADEVVIKIRAVNPLDTEAVTPVRAYLPKPAGPEDVIGYSEEWIVKSEKRKTKSEKLTTKFDEEKGQYYIEQEITLAPKKVAVLEVRVKDVWVVPEERIEKLRKQVEEVISGQWTVDSEKQKAKNEKSLVTNHYSLATELKEEILKSLDRIVERQAENTVALVGAERHIKAYEENVKALKQAEMDLEVLRKLVGSRQ